MKNTKKMTSLVGSHMSDRLSNRILAAVLFSLVALSVAVPSQAQRTTFTMPRFTPPAQTYHPPAQTYHPPAQTYHPPAQTYHPPAQTSRPAQTQPRPAQPQSSPRTTGSTPQARPQSTQPRPSAPSRKEVQQHEKAHARAQKDEQKQNQKAQKEQARQQKEQQKQQQKRAKEQQKEQARQQKELQKKQQSDNKAAKSAKASKPQTVSPAVAKAPASKAGARNSTEAPASESQTRIQQLNASRSSMSGINRKPLPTGEVTVHSNGRMTLKAEGGRQYGLRSNGTIASYSDREKTVSFDKRGQVSSIHTANMDIHNGAHGQRTIISRRADGSKVVSTGRHSGYVERSVVMNNRTYVQRTMLINQRVYTHTYLANGFGGVAFVPPAFFAPGFYGWAYYPWAAPISFTWGWFGAPWYTGPYFVASPRYPGAAFWLTDYMIGETLATAYQLHHDASGFDDASDDMSSDDISTDDISADSTDAGTSADGDSDRTSDQETVRADATTPITPELKAEIAEEIRQQLANDNAEASNPSQASFNMLPAALSTPNHVFVVSNDLDVTTTDQQLCALQAGDMLQLMTPAASDSGLVELRVASSKRTDCPAGVLVSVSLTDLQEMQNNFQAQIEAGLGTLRDNQGRNGLPSAPPDAIAAPPRPVTGLAPFSAADSAVALDQQREQADQAEKQAASGSL